MSYQRVAEGIYQDPRTGNFYERPTIGGRRTWRKLEGHTLKLARESLAQRRTDQARASRGMARDPYAPKPVTIGTLIELYIAAGCPDRFDQVKAGHQEIKELSRLKILRPFWADRDPESIAVQADCRRYRESRRRSASPGKGGRAVDLELNTLANVLRFALQRGKILENPLAAGRPRFAPAVVRHSRDLAPANGEELHALAAHLFEDKRSESLGWQLLIQAMTGCRTSEVLRLRWDAGPGHAGFVEKDWLWLSRAKGGVNPFALVHPALAETLKALAAWRALRGWQSSPWFFPSPKVSGAAVISTALTAALRSASPLVVGRQITSHGLRSYYVTVRRSQGVLDSQIAAEIGDRTGAPIVVSTYGAIPPNWQGREGIGWMPEKSPPAWALFGLHTVRHTNKRRLRPVAADPRVLDKRPNGSRLRLLPVRSVRPD